MEIERVADKKFSTKVEGGEAVLIYRRGPENSFDILGVEVPPPARGKNVADQLMREAVKAARAENVKVVASCSYAVHWFDTHPDEEDILLHER
ncbi:GNAT family N-acetyltransferase [Bdellovibrio bacteriovorus]|uniref:GNAT family N-acetyltransferase n=1 Tax=Bdellovibrio TaxID=958 RepID=UPI0035A8ABE0